jgi:P-loop Domain of unknown function (DUF2791)
LIIVAEEIDVLRRGQPPKDPELLQAMTLGRKLWLDYLQNHYLDGYIERGGSKVKVLVGSPGTGKTHLLRSALLDGAVQGYATVYLSARQFKLNDLPGFYQGIVAQLDFEQLVRGLCVRVVEQMGYDQSIFDTDRLFVSTLYDEEGLPRDLAIREIKKATRDVFRNVDFGPSFRTFAYHIVANRMIYGNEGDIHTALKWLTGGKLGRAEKQDTLLFERLQKSNARYWLNSLICLLRVAGIRGLIVAVDDLEVIAERDPATRRFYYTANAAKDICELLRQLIDDVELLSHFLLLLAGRHEMILDDKRGFMSYDALWMRLQTGLITKAFNPLADVMDTYKHLKANGEDFPEQVHTHLRQLLIDAGLVLEYRGLPELSHHGPLRARVIEVASLVPREEEP